MAETGDVGIFHGAKEAGSVVFFVRAEAGVDGGDDVIQLREHGVGKIEFATFEDVALRAGEEGAGGIFRSSGQRWNQIPKWREPRIEGRRGRAARSRGSGDT